MPLDRDLKKKELASVSTYTINKLDQNENVTIQVLAKICIALDYIIDDILEVLYERDGERNDE
ncbi:MAG: helix-turn-helix domain-containing protein [Clostridiales bacterium]|nr:helix-turn-helix domain-containing protein [Clostridiales bacterium]